MPPVSGHYDIAISLHGLALPDSPYSVAVMMPRPDAANCQLKGDALSTAVAREGATFGACSHSPALPQHMRPCQRVRVVPCQRVGVVPCHRVRVVPCRRVRVRATLCTRRVRALAHIRMRICVLRAEVSFIDALGQHTHAEELDVFVEPLAEGESGMDALEELTTRLEEAERRAREGIREGSSLRPGEASRESSEVGSPPMARSSTPATSGAAAAAAPEKASPEKASGGGGKASPWSMLREGLKGAVGEATAVESELDAEATRKQREEMQREEESRVRLARNSVMGRPVTRLVVGPKPLIVRADSDMGSEQVGALAVGSLVQVVETRRTADGLRARVHLVPPSLPEVWQEELHAMSSARGSAVTSARGSARSSARYGAGGAGGGSSFGSPRKLEGGGLPRDGYNIHPVTKPPGASPRACACASTRCTYTAPHLRTLCDTHIHPALCPSSPLSSRPPPRPPPRPPLPMAPIPTHDPHTYP